MDAQRSISYGMSRYVGMLRRHWWIIALLTAVGLVGGVGVARTRPKVYESTTRVLVMSTSVSDATAAGGRTSDVINLRTEAQLVTSAEVARAAAQLLGTTTSPATLGSFVTVDAPANTSVMSITYAATTPAAAQAGSHAFATAYLSNRQDSAQADLTGQIDAIDSAIARERSSLSKVDDSLATLSPGSARYADEQSARQTLTSQINSLTSRMNNLATTTVASGRIITDAGLPTKPAKPSVPLHLAGGALLGILLGLVLAILRQWSNKVVRVANDVPRRSGLPLLAQVPARAKPRFDGVFPPHGTGGRTFDRLRGEVLAGMRAEGQVIMVTGAGSGGSSALVSANLAAALARAGSEVVLICAHLPESIVEADSITRMLGVAATPGLHDVLAGDVPLEVVAQRAPRTPWLRVITAGDTPLATGFPRSRAWRDILGALRMRAEYVVIEAPSTAGSTDARFLARFADAAIVVAEMKRTRHAEVLAAADQLRRATTGMVGCVVLPRVRRSGKGVPAAPPRDVESRPATPPPVYRDAPRRPEYTVDTDEDTQVIGLVAPRMPIDAIRPDEDAIATSSDPTIPFDVPVQTDAAARGARTSTMAPERPRAAWDGDTVRFPRTDFFQRIDLVYVDTGDGTGTAR
jgi:uncharacterized protein involved in exopolysaccharide biosynthesis/Mrp family chromosome partitioning ATPase